MQAGEGKWFTDPELFPGTSEVTDDEYEAPEEVLVLQIDGVESLKALSNDISEWLRLVIFSGVMFPADPAVVIDEGEQVILRYFSNVEKQIPLSQLLVRAVRAEDLISRSPTTHLQVYRQRTKYPEDLIHELPISGWRSVLRKLISHLKETRGGQNVLVLYRAQYLRLGRVRAERSSRRESGGSKRMFVARVPGSQEQTAHILAQDLLDWGMGLQFSSEGSWLSLRPLPPFSVFPTDKGLEILFHPGSDMRSKLRLEVEVESAGADVLILTSSSKPRHYSPRQISERLQRHLKDRYPLACFEFPQSGRGRPGRD
ncbi:hypothetical protein NDN08_006247 [Rhodosorus marinus]|uniref:Uncharacterized protein n=1 Tax=Rhodosorus marinus TaxID=101924 RepID=A0AAV8UK89_9RHOD|nr:hypothetical protein NDN08_006247 [Rhodosorus marinus]